MKTQHDGSAWGSIGSKAWIGVCIQMVCSWVLVHAGPINDPLQAYYNLVVDETQLSQL
jgi:hypothetical protein